MQHPASAAPARDARRWFAMIPMLTGILIGSVTISSATTALPSMAEDLGLSPVEATWIIDSYPLALAVSLVVAARLGDRFGRRRVMMLGLLGFAAFNLAGGFATTGLGLIAARVLLGVAEALVIASVVATIGVQFRARERVLAYGMWTATFGAGSAIGPLVGGVLSDGPGWRWIMLGAVPVALTAAALAAWLIPESRTSQPPTWDVASIALSVVALGGLVYALQHATLAPISSAVLGVAGAVSLVWFVRRQRRLVDPLIDVLLFRNGRFSIAYLRILIGTAVSSGTVYLISLHLQQQRGATAIEAGLTLLPHAVMIVLGGALAPLTLRALSNSGVTTLALLLQAAGLAWASVQPASFLPPLLMVGFGMGFVGTLAATALFDVTTADQAGQVGAVQEIAFALGAGLGIAAFGAVTIALGGEGFRVAFLAAAGVAAVAAALPVLVARPPKATKTPAGEADGSDPRPQLAPDTAS